MYLSVHGEGEDRLYHQHRFWRCVHTLRFEAREDKDEIVVEIRKLVELLQFLSGSVKGSNFSHTHFLLLFDIWKVYMYRNQSDADDSPAPNQNLTLFFSSSTSYCLTQTHTHARVSGYFLHGSLCCRVRGLRVLQQLKHLLQTLFIWLPLHPKTPNIQDKISRAREASKLSRICKLGTGRITTQIT